MKEKIFSSVTLWQKRGSLFSEHNKPTSSAT